MTAIAELSQLIGKWQGTNQLWLFPGDPVRLSHSLAEIRAISHDQFTELRYTWAEDGQPQEGQIILGQPSDSTQVKAVWLDTWHMAHQFMVCEGEIDENGAIWVKGSYAAPPGPDWGWKIALVPEGQDAFRFLMYNITPEGEEFLAVEVAYTRQPGTN